MKFKNSYLVASSLLIATLTGCASKSIPPDFSFNSGRGEGIAVISISHDLAGRRGAQAIFYMDGGLMRGGDVLTSRNEVAPGVIRASEFKDSYGRILVLALPIGEHQIESWQIANSTGLRIFPREKPMPLKFEVRSGEIKYLGNLHANLQTGKNIFGITITADGFPEVRDQRQRDIGMFEARYPQFQGKILVELLPIGPWLTSAETIKHIDIAPVMPIRR